MHVVNTHYDDRGVQARAQSSLLIRQAIKEFVNESESKGAPKNGPVLLFGDFSEYMPEKQNRAPRMRTGARSKCDCALGFCLLASDNGPSGRPETLPLHAPAHVWLCNKHHPRVLSYCRTFHFFTV